MPLTRWRPHLLSCVSVALLRAADTLAGRDVMVAQSSGQSQRSSSALHNVTEGNEPRLELMHAGGTPDSPAYSRSSEFSAGSSALASAGGSREGGGSSRPVPAEAVDQVARSRSRSSTGTLSTDESFQSCKESLPDPSHRPPRSQKEKLQRRRSVAQNEHRCFVFLTCVLSAGSATLKVVWARHRTLVLSPTPPADQTQTPKTKVTFPLLTDP